MTPGQLAAIEARADAATPEPWSWDESMVEAPGGEIIWWPANATEDSPLGACGENAEAHEADNFEFLAHARTDVPALLAALDQARAERDEARRQLDAVRQLADAWVAFSPADRQPEDAASPKMRPSTKPAAPSCDYSTDSNPPERGNL